jgi:MoxR-like ATPase
MSQSSAATSPVAPADADAAEIGRLGEISAGLRREVAKAIVGQEQTIEHLLISLMAGGHCLLVGVPGLAKTLMVSTLARCLDLSFRRIQFTPDLMPADITGVDIIEEDPQGRRQFVFRQGPLFANIILADEINRTPPKTQSALLEAMQERSVTVAGRTYTLAQPFFVLATQNPVEQEGTYPLPEAQLDRFLFCLNVTYPSHAEAVQILQATTTGAVADLKAVVTGEQLIRLQQAIRRIPAAQTVLDHAVSLVERTRPGPQAPARIQRYVRYGAGPRGSQALVVAAKVRAALRGRFHVERDDIDALVDPVLRHRVLLNYHAEADGIKPEDLLGDLRG